RSMKELLEVTEEVKALGANCLPVLADVSDYEAVKEMFEEISLFCENIDCVINNAGMSHVGLFTDMTTYCWDKIISTNLTSAFNICHHSVPNMIRAQSGTIINISSIWGIVGASMEVAYSASKGGLNAFTKALAKELGPSHIRVNAIACGAIETSMNTWLSDEEKQSFEEGIALCRFGKTEEVANLAFFLASEAAGYLTGEIIRLDGGAL
ncbi:MAG: SDR family oxidoreductase, partial [Vallitaleaceae bacterium]|nr:SDR family oxidoreductase [Vallitaleaceae bacterium]